MTPIACARRWRARTPDSTSSRAALSLPRPAFHGRAPLVRSHPTATYTGHRGREHAPGPTASGHISKRAAGLLRILFSRRSRFLAALSSSRTPPAPKLPSPSGCPPTSSVRVRRTSPTRCCSGKRASARVTLHSAGTSSMPSRLQRAVHISTGRARATAGEPCGQQPREEAGATRRGRPARIEVGFHARQVALE